MNRRHSRWRRLGVVAAILVLGALLQYGVFFRRITFDSGFSLGLAGIGVLLLIGVLTALILWRGWRGKDPLIASVFGLAGSLLFAILNLRRPSCATHPRPQSFPYLDYYSGPGWVQGHRMWFYPELEVVQPSGRCQVSVNLVVLGGAVILFTAWLWLGDVPDELLERFVATSDES